MSTVAVIGPDGAGKTTVCRALERSSVLPLKYIYMGVNVAASNVTLPTTRLVARIRRRRRLADSAETAVTTSDSSRRGSILRGVHVGAYLSYWLAEQTYRQLVSWMYQLRGYVVLYDRHFLLDFAPAIGSVDPISRRLYTWTLAHLHPRPTLVIYLDAPADVLFARKGEFTPQQLKAKGTRLLRDAALSPFFARIDATQPIENVCADADRIIRTFVQEGKLAATDRYVPGSAIPRLSTGWLVSDAVEAPAEYTRRPGDGARR